MRLLALILAAIFILVSPAHAKHRHHKHHRAHHAHMAAPAVHKDCNVLFPCEVTVNLPTRAIASGMVRVATSTIVAHPAGCPARAFCGCGAAVRVFGRPVRDLWLAANWYRFPRAEPAPGMAAVRPHHVFVLEAHLGGNVWQVFDANSGRHATRIHARSITRYTIVNPRAG